MVTDATSEDLRSDTFALTAEQSFPSFRMYIGDAEKLSIIGGIKSPLKDRSSFIGKAPCLYVTETGSDSASQLEDYLLSIIFLGT